MLGLVGFLRSMRIIAACSTGSCRQQRCSINDMVTYKSRRPAEGGCSSGHVTWTHNRVPLRYISHSYGRLVDSGSGVQPQRSSHIRHKVSIFGPIVSIEVSVQWNLVNAVACAHLENLRVATEIV